jgi:hypothetical protein
MNKPSGFGDAETRRILERAAEIDAHRPLDANALREIALEAGISPASLEQALAEHREAAATAAAIPEPVKPTITSRLKEKRLVIIIALVLAFFFLMRTVERVSP